MPVPSCCNRRTALMGAGLTLIAGGAGAWMWMTSRTSSLPPGFDTAELDEMRLPSPRDPDEALERLINGNQLFVSEYYAIGDARRNQAHRLTIAEKQNPFAVILGCADSRVAPELLFSAGLGDLFVVRVAGNFVDPRCFSVIGSIEYAIHELQVPLIVVLGHEQCGAVKAAVRMVQEKIDLPDAIGAIANSIRPIIESVADKDGNVVARSVEANAQHGVRMLLSLPILKQPLAAARLKVVGASYDLRTGYIRILD